MCLQDKCQLAEIANNNDTIPSSRSMCTVQRPAANFHPARGDAIGLLFHRGAGDVIWLCAAEAAAYRPARRFFSQLKVALCWAGLNNSTWIIPPGYYFVHMYQNPWLNEVFYGVKYHWHQHGVCTLWTNSLVPLPVNALIRHGKRCLRFYFSKQSQESS